MARVHKCGKNNGIQCSGTVYEMKKVEIPTSSDDEKETNNEGYICGGDSLKGDELWHEEQMYKHSKLIVKQKISEYVHSFTVHGLTKVFTGSKIESVFWSTMLLGGIMLSIVICHGRVSKYLDYGIYAEIRSQITDQNYFPSVTFCEDELLMETFLSYCGVAPSIRHKNDSMFCENRYHETDNRITEDSNKYWSNGVFNVTGCGTGAGKRCANSKYFKSLNHFNHSCMTWNYDGTLHDIYSHVGIEFKYIKPKGFDILPVIIAIPHDPAIHEIDLTNKVDIEPKKSYEIKLDKTVIKRLPTPYPSNCTNSKLGDIFPGRYTRRSCIESHNYIEMYKHCGDAPDYIRKFIPKDILKNYAKNLTIRQAEICIELYLDREVKKSSDCVLPCNDLDLSITSTFHERGIQEKDDNSYYINLQFQSVDTYKVMEEKELYSWDQMACEIGGLIGLIIGASVISLVEICAYFFLCCLKRFYERKKR